MKLILRRFRMAIVALTLAHAAGAQTASREPLRLTLNDAIVLALRQQPDLISAQAQANAARQNLIQVRSAFYPTISLNYTTNDSYQSNGQTLTNSTSGTQIATTTSTTSSTRDGDILLSYQLLDSGQRVANEQSARASSKAYSFAAQNERQLTIANAASAYYSLLRLRALVKVQEANVENAQATRDLTKAQVERGGLAAKDVYQAEADLENARVSLLQSQNNASVAVATLKQTLGIASDEQIEPSDNPTTIGVSKDADQDLATLIQVAYAARPDVLQAVQNVERDKAGVRYARAANGLTLSVDTNLTAFFAPSGSNSRSIGLTASLPIFNAGSGRAAVNEAKETQRSTEAQLASKKLSASVDVETAYRTLQTARASVPAARTAQQAAQINYDAALEARKEGIGTVVDVISAQSQLVTAQTNYVQALYDLYTADVTLQRAIGHADAIMALARGVR